MFNVNSCQQVLIVNSDQLSLLENSQEIVVMQGTDPEALEVFLSDLSSSAIDRSVHS